MKTVVFICVENSNRSQMAEAFARIHGAGKVEAFSAGSRPSGQWLERQGVQVQRINPAHQPTLFAASELVRAELKRHGSACLPVVVVNDAVVSRGIFPTRSQLAGWTGITLGSLPEFPVTNPACCGVNEGKTRSSSSCCC